MQKNKYIVLVALLFPVLAVKAQLTFPAGTVLNLQSNNAFMYQETGIFFNTGINKVTDYRWYKMPSDSLDSRWDFQACMNGDCKVGLPASGDFITDFGINDTTGFIKFHVTTMGLNGASWLSYCVAHKSDTADQAVLTWNVRYTNNTGLYEQVENGGYEIYPNPVQDQLTIAHAGALSGRYELLHSDGKSVLNGTLPSTKTFTLKLPGLQQGVYILRIISENNIYNRLVIPAP